MDHHNWPDVFYLLIPTVPAAIAATAALMNRHGQNRADKDRAVMKSQLEQNTAMTRDLHQAANGNHDGK